jgi:hypothetical protein
MMAILFKILAHFSTLVFLLLPALDPVLASLPSLPRPTTVCTLHPTYTFHTLNRTIRFVMQDAIRFAKNYTLHRRPKKGETFDTVRSLYFLFLLLI